MKTLMSRFCIFNDNLRKFLLVEAGWIVICHLLLVGMFLSDHIFFPVSFFLSFCPGLPLLFFFPPSPAPSFTLPFLICMCYCKSPIQMEVYMPLLSQFKTRTQNGRCATEYVTISSVPYFDTFQFVHWYKCKLGKRIKHVCCWCCQMFI